MKLPRWMEYFGRHISRLQLQQATTAMLGGFIRMCRLSASSLGTTIRTYQLQSRYLSAAALPTSGVQFLDWTLGARLFRKSYSHQDLFNLAPNKSSGDACRKLIRKWPPRWNTRGLLVVIDTFACICCLQKDLS